MLYVERNLIASTKMPSDNYLIDAATRHQVFLQRYGNGRAKDAVKLLNRLRRRINARLSQEPEEFRAQRLQDLLKDIDSLNKEEFQNVKTLIELESMKLIPSETSFNTVMLNNVSSVDFISPQETVLIAAVMATPMSVKTGIGFTIADALTDFGAKKGSQILQSIIDGVTSGSGTSFIAKQVDGLIRNLMKRQVTSLISTIINHISSTTRSELYKKNSRLVDRYEWVSTLDGRTTFICMSRDGKYYRVGTGPMPPAHFGCRSTTIPKIKKEFDLGLDVDTKRPAVGDSGVEQVSAKVTYGGWLKKQNKEFVDEALGVERSRLFRSGKLSLDNFVDPTGRVYTLSQLESMNPIVFSDLIGGQ